LGKRYIPEFIDELVTRQAQGLDEPYLLAVATAITVLFSLAPTYLKYRRQNRLIQRTVISAAAIQAALLVLLVPNFAATGTALAYTISVCGMYLVFTLTAHRELVMLRSSR
jgi:O-antigen/teichoic acid export membrane protein